MSAVDELESFVFGDVKEEEETASSCSESEAEESAGGRKKQVEAAAAIIKKKAADDSTKDASDSQENEEEEVADQVWRDSEDEADYIDISSHSKFRKLINLGRPSSSGDQVTGTDFHERLRKYRLSRSGASSWAAVLRQRKEQPDNKEEDDNDSSDASSVKKDAREAPRVRTNVSKFVASSVPIIKSKAGSLPPATIKYISKQNANAEEHSQCALTCCGFFPGSSNKFYTAGSDKSIKIFGDFSKGGKKLHSVHFKKSPIKSTAELTSPEVSVIGVCGHRTLFHLDAATASVTLSQSLKSAGRFTNLHEVATGPAGSSIFAVLANCGHVLVGDIKSKSVAQNLKMNALGRGVVFVGEHNLFTGDDDGMVYEWDLRAGRCLHTFQDEGSRRVTCIAASERYLAVGSRSGYVNIYDINRGREVDTLELQTTSSSSSFFEDVVNQTPVARERRNVGDKPSLVKTLSNLTTEVTCIKFHPSAQLLAISSSWTVEGSVKLVHIPSFTTYRNFPSQTSSGLWNICSTAFNDSGNLMALGNSQGEAKLFLLPYFTSRRRTA